MRRFTILIPALILLAVFSTSCSQENVSPQGQNNGSTDLHASVNPHPLLATICGPMISYPLAGANGDQNIPLNFREGGSAWGTATIYNGEDANGKATVAIDYQLAQNWFIKEITYFYGKGGNLKLTAKGEPEINGNFVAAPVNPLVNATQIRVGLNGLGLENVLVSRLEVGQLDFFNPNAGLDPSTVQYIYVYNDLYSGPRPNTQYFEAGYSTIKCN